VSDIIITSGDGDGAGTASSSQPTHFVLRAGLRRVSAANEGTSDLRKRMSESLRTRNGNGFDDDEEAAAAADELNAVEDEEATTLLYSSLD
jgi:hypothetical protein